MASTLGQLANSPMVRAWIRQQMVDEFGEERVVKFEQDCLKVTGSIDPFGDLRERLGDETE